MPGIVISMLPHTTTGVTTSGTQFWLTFLVVNYFFLSLFTGIIIFYSLQIRTKSKWSSPYLHITVKLLKGFPLVLILFLVYFIGIAFGANQLLPSFPTNSPGLSFYFNKWFLILRIVIFFSTWLILFNKLKRSFESNDEKKIHFTARATLIVVAFSFTLFTLDSITMLQNGTHSSIFALKNLVSAFHSGTAITLLSLLLSSKHGHANQFPQEHLSDSAKYLFMLSILFGYFWYMPYMLTWYGNVTEEMEYFALRTAFPNNILFYAEIILSSALPFILLLTNKLRKSKMIVHISIISVLFGNFTGIFLHVMAGQTSTLSANFILTSGVMLLISLAFYFLFRKSLFIKELP